MNHSMAMVNRRFRTDFRQCDEPPLAGDEANPRAAAWPRAQIFVMKPSLAPAVINCHNMWE